MSASYTMPGFVAVTVGLWMLVQLPVAPLVSSSAEPWALRWT